MEEVQPSTSTEVESEDISEYEPEPVEKINKPVNVMFNSKHVPASKV